MVVIVGITGTNGAGKGTVVDYLKQKFNFAHYSAREFIYEEIDKRGLDHSRDSLIEVANDLRQKHGPAYVAESLYKRAKESNQNVIIESLRTLGEIDSLRKKEGQFYLFAIDANQRIRYERIHTRQSQTDDVSFDEFSNKEKLESYSDDPNKQNLSACISQADFVFNNDGTIEELKTQIDSALEKMGLTSSNSLARKDAISWDDYFMGVAMLSAMRSKDPSSQVGSCIVNDDNRIVGIGYNGAPRGFSDDKFPWARTGPYLETKYPFVVHSEANAILNATTSLKHCRIYVALIPCNECAKLIVQSGITEVVYISEKYKDIDAFKAAPIMFKEAGITLRKYEPTQNILIDFEKINK